MEKKDGQPSKEQRMLLKGQQKKQAKQDLPLGRVDEDVDQNPERICQPKGDLHPGPAPSALPVDWRLERARAAAFLINKIAHLKPMATLKCDGYTFTNRYEDQPSLDIRAAMEGAGFMQETIEFFTAFFDPKKGAELPRHLWQQRHQKKFGKFPFFLNRTTTPLVFRLMLQNDDYVRILYGRPFIGKSISLMLYCHLARFITDYDQFHPASEFKDIPRGVYLNYKSVQDNQEVQQMIKQQYPRGAKKKLRSQKPYRVLVFDQFNQLVKDIHAFNKQLKEQGSVKQKQLQIEGKKKAWFINNLLLFESYILFNSSANVERGLLRQGQLRDQGFMDLGELRGSHGHRLEILQLRLQGAPQENRQMKLDFLRFELLKHSEVEPDLSTIPDELDRLPLLLIRDLARQCQKDINRAKTLIVFKFREYISGLKEGVENRLKKQEKPEQLALFDFYLNYRHAILCQATQLPSAQTLEKKVFNLLDKDLFHVNDCSQSAVVISKEEFQELTSDLGKMFLQLGDDIFKKAVTKYFRHNNAILGTLVEVVILQQIRRQRDTILNLVIGSQRINIAIDKTFEFLHFDAGSEFLQRFQVAFQEKKKMEKDNLNFAGFPVDKKGQKSEISKSIDLLILKVYERTFRLLTIDFTVASDEASLVQKQNNAQRLISKQINQYEAPETYTLEFEEWTHVILSKQSGKKKVKVETGKGGISTRIERQPISSLVLQNCAATNENLKFLLQQVKSSE